MNNIEITSVIWSDIKGEVQAVNPGIYDILNQGNMPRDEMRLYTIDLPLGHDIILEGQACLFESLDSLQFSNCTLDSFRKDFKGRLELLPLTMVLKGVVEIYDRNSTQYGNRGRVRYTFPLNIIGPGQVFGTYETIDRILGEVNVKYNYNASSGHRSIYPILPDKGSQKFITKMERWYNAYRKADKSDSEPTILDVFPMILKDIGNRINYKTRLLVIPPMWYESVGDQVNSFKVVVTELGWQQMRDQVFNHLHVMNIYRDMENRNRRGDVLLISQFTNYLRRALLGKMPLLKFDKLTGYEYLKDVRAEFIEMIDNEYEPALLYFDFPLKGEKGIVPFAILPFKTSAKISRGAAELYNKLSESLRHYDTELFFKLRNNAIGGNYSENSENPLASYVKEIYGQENLFTKSFLAKIIVELEKE